MTRFTGNCGFEGQRHSVSTCRLQIIGAIERVPRRIESLLVDVRKVVWGYSQEPDDQEPVEAAVVCHPHPQGGGTMHNKVVYRLARGLRKAGCTVLRFNFRGVNLSAGAYDQGIGETEDARAALSELRRRYPAVPALIAGFSFGSRVALRGCGR